MKCVLNIRRLPPHQHWLNFNAFVSRCVWICSVHTKTARHDETIMYLIKWLTSHELNRDFGLLFWLHFYAARRNRRVYWLYTGWKWIKFCICVSVTMIKCEYAMLFWLRTLGRFRILKWKIESSRFQLNPRIQINRSQAEQLSIICYQFCRTSNLQFRQCKTWNCSMWSVPFRSLYESNRILHLQPYSTSHICVLFE